MNINEVSVLITGGASGIGLYLAEGLLEKVNRVFVLDRNEQLLNHISDHDRLIKLPCDVTNPHAVVEVVNKIFSDHGGVNVCINNVILSLLENSYLSIFLFLKKSLGVTK